jgi:hypothetical protein
MKRNSYSSLAFAVVVALGMVASSLAIAQGTTCPGNTPNINSVVVTERVYNNCPASTITTVNNYPSLVSIRDTDADCVGWTNKHIFSLSEDGVSPAVFENCSHYRYGATFMISRAPGAGGNAEGGLRLAPWWGLDGDGFFMVHTGGEISAWGMRAPSYNFTTTQGLHYTVGNPIYLEMIYNPRQLSQAFPATITFNVMYLAQHYTSGPLPFDEGNPAEGALHGTWGELSPARLGGYFQVPEGSFPLYDLTATWSDFQWEGPSATPAARATWGQLKIMYR